MGKGKERGEGGRGSNREVEKGECGEEKEELKWRKKEERGVGVEERRRKKRRSGEGKKEEGERGGGMKEEAESGGGMREEAESGGR